MRHERATLTAAHFLSAAVEVHRMPSRSSEDIVERIKALEEEVYPDGINTPDVARTGATFILKQEDGDFETISVTGDATIDTATIASLVAESGDVTDLTADEAEVANTLSATDVDAAETVDATTASADSIKARDNITDAYGTEIRGFVGANVFLNENKQLAVESALDVRRAVNEILYQNAEQDFQLGLTRLNYSDGQYEIFATDENIRDITHPPTAIIGDTLKGRGYVGLKNYYAPSNQLGVLNETAPAANTSDAYPTGGIVLDEQAGVGFGIHTADYALIKFDINTLEVLASGESTGVIDGGGNILLTSDHFIIGGKKYDRESLSKVNEYTGNGGGVNAVDEELGYAYSGGGSGTVYQIDLETFTDTGASFTSTTGGDGYGVYDVAVGGGVGFAAGSEFSEVEKFDAESMEFISSGGYGNQKTLIVGKDNNYLYAAENSEIEKFEYDDLSNSIRVDYGQINKGIGETDDFLFTVVSYDGSDFEPEIAKLDKSNLSILDTVPYTESIAPNTPVAVTVGDRGVYVYDAGDESNSIAGEIGVYGDRTKPTQNRVSHTFDTFDFTPTEIVVSHDVENDTASNAVYYEIEDADGNVATVSEADVDSIVDTSNLTSSEVSVTAILERDTETDTPPRLNAYSAYLD